MAHLEEAPIPVWKKENMEKVFSQISMVEVSRRDMGLPEMPESAKYNLEVALDEAFLKLVQEGRLSLDLMKRKGSAEAEEVPRKKKSKKSEEAEIPEEELVEIAEEEVEKVAKKKKSEKDESKDIAENITEPLKTQIELKKLQLMDKLLTKENLVQELTLEKMLKELKEKGEVSDSVDLETILALMNQMKTTDPDKLLAIMAIMNKDPRWLLFAKLLNSAGDDGARAEAVGGGGGFDPMLMMLMMMLMMED